MKEAQQLMDLLLKRHMTFGSAESCTGGNIAHEMTMLAGVSEVYLGSVVSYSNEVTTGVLHGKEQTLASYGAVSEQTAREMAEGARKVLGVDCAVATSGIAGPGGAVPGKPVGTVCMAFSTPEATVSHTFHFPGSRAEGITAATATALAKLAKMLA